jgi:hypothetical protein
MTDGTVQLTGLILPGLNQSQTTLAGAYTASGLTDLLVSEWIPYLECEECGRHSYCKFTRPDPNRPGRLADIQCGVVETAIRNYVSAVFPLVQQMSQKERQAVLTGSYHLMRFVYQAEQQIGLMLSDDFMDWLGDPDARAAFFGLTARLRRHLDQFAGEVRSIDAFRTRGTVVLTEGPSERAFLERLRLSGLANYVDLDVQSYYGRGNRGPTKLRLLAERLHRQGYELFIQGDCDGRVRDIFDALVREGVVGSGSTFAFEVDFETAFPPGMLYVALRDLGELDGVDFSTFEHEVRGTAQGHSVVEVLRTEFGTEVDKVELAEALGTQLIEGLDLWRNDSSFWSTEIGRFVDKVARLP